eukprot:scaffold7362_cov266-Pinguiococcus_pyrenoidosus.AAC.17
MAIIATSTAFIATSTALPQSLGPFVCSRDYDRVKLNLSVQYMILKTYDAAEELLEALRVQRPDDVYILNNLAILAQEVRYPSLRCGRLAGFNGRRILG